MTTNRHKKNIPNELKRHIAQFMVMLFSSLFLVSTVSAQLPDSDLGIDLENPNFLREFNGSFEVGLRAGAPAMSERDSVMISVVSEMYQRDVDAALEFIMEELRNEDRRIEAAQRYGRTLDLDYVYSANIEYTIGQLYQLKGNRASAERYYLQAIEKYPSYVSSFVRLMEIYLSQEDCEKAIAAGRKAVEIGGVNGLVFKGFGLCFFLEEDYSAALSAFRSAKAFLPEDESNDYYYAQSAINAGYASEAIHILDELIRAYPDNPNYYFLQVNAFLLEGDDDGLLGTLDIARRKGMLNASTYSLLGNIYVNRSMPEAAAEAYISGLGLDEPPTFSTAKVQFQYLSRLADWQLSENYLNRVSDVYQGRLRANERRELEIMQARVLIDSGRATDGAALLREVIDADPTNGDALLSLARYYRQQQDFERAAIYFERAASDEVVALDALMESAQLAIDEESWNQAIELLTKASETAPSDSLPIILENIRAIERVIDILD